MQVKQFRFQHFLKLIRALFPRWDFFDRVGYVYKLEIKNSITTPWQKITYEAERSALSLFVNPQGNETLAQFNILEHFVSEINEAQADRLKAEDLTSYKLLVSFLLLKNKNQQFKFKVTAVGVNDEQEVYTSEWIKAVVT